MHGGRPGYRKIYICHNFGDFIAMRSIVSMWPKGRTWYLISVHGFDPSWIPHFQNTEHILDEEYYHVHGSCGSATPSCTLYSHATRKWKMSCLSTLTRNHLSCHKLGKIGANLVPGYCMYFINYCMSCCLILELIRKVVACTNVWSHNLHHCMYVCRWKENWASGV